MVSINPIGKKNPGKDNNVQFPKHHRIRRE
jgi:hypothetical protein